MTGTEAQLGICEPYKACSQQQPPLEEERMPQQTWISQVFTVALSLCLVSTLRSEQCVPGPVLTYKQGPSLCGGCLTQLGHFLSSVCMSP